MITSLRCAGLLTLAAVVFHLPLAAQGTLADYRR
jgi:hypothetical protein